MTRQRPLAGRTILELARPDGSEVTARAVALAGRIAADFGATVIKVEPPEGDRLRQAPPFVTTSAGGRESATFVFLNGGKKSLQLSDSSAADATLEVLASRADGLLTDRDADRLGALGNVPIRVLVDHGVPAGAGIPHGRVTDTTILALSGLLDLIGDPAQAPVPLGGHQASYVAGLAAFSGLASALAAKELGCPRETVRVSAVEANLWSNWKSFAERLYMGRSPSRQGALAEWQAFPCTDGFAALVYLDKDWPAITKMIGKPELAQPPFDTRDGRKANIQHLYAPIKAWFAARSRRDIYRHAKEAGLPFGPILTVAEILKDPQYAAQRFLAPAAIAGEPQWQVPSVPVVWNGERFYPHQAADRETGMNTTGTQP